MANELAFDTHCAARTVAVPATKLGRISRIAWLLVVASILTLLHCPMATAQSTTGSIYGQITDQSGALACLIHQN
jgi:hypothetical protein